MNYSNNIDDTILTETELPLFPLKSILFPHGALALKVFEPRYLDMLTQCEKTGSGFGICLISDGNEVGDAPEIYSVGTFVEITYWEHRKDGLIGISVKGKQKFNVLSKQVQNNELILAEIEFIDEEPVYVLPEQYQSMVNVLKKIFAALQHPYITLPKKYDDASWVGSRLSELLPLSMIKKQQLLELNEPMARLAMLYDEMLNLGMLSE